jgi:glucosamine-phosphate N-acetyltransferase
MSILDATTPHVRGYRAAEDTANSAAPTAAAPVVRRLRVSDYDHGFLETLSALRPTEMSREQFATILHSLGDDCRVWVAEVDGAVAATTTLLIERKFIHAGGIVGHVEDVAVNRNFQGRGIGKLLMEQVIAEARAAGCYKVILDCSDRVCGFYQSLGFRPQEISMRIDLV